MASVGIPSYRLPKDVLKADGEDIVRELGGQFFFGRLLGRDFSVDDLMAKGYDAAFLAYGASQGGALGIHNEDPELAGYVSGIEFLEAAMDIYPMARRVLLTAYADTHAAIDAINALFDHRFVLRCDLTDMPLAKQPYRLRWKDQVIEGVTDEKGQTSAIPTGSSAAEVTCEILGEAING